MQTYYFHWLNPKYAPVDVSDEVYDLVHEKMKSFPFAGRHPHFVMASVMPIIAADCLARKAVRFNAKGLKETTEIFRRYSVDVNNVMKMRCFSLGEALNFCKTIKKAIRFIDNNPESVGDDISMAVSSLKSCLKKCQLLIDVLRDHGKNAQWESILTFLAWSPSRSYIRSIREFVHRIYPQNSQWGCNTSQALSTMKKEGIISNPERGFWKLADGINMAC